MLSISFFAFRFFLFYLSSHMDLDVLIRLISFSDANTRVVVIGAGLLGLCSGVVGTLGVLRRRALVGDAVAHAALPGVCIAFLILGERNLPGLLLGAFIVGTLAAWLIALIRRHTRIKEDAAIALVIGCFFGVGIVLSQIIQGLTSGSRAGLDDFIFGKAATMVRSDALTIAGVTVTCLIIVAILHKELRTLCFDRDFGQSLGWRMGTLDALVMTLVALTTVAGLPAVGVVMIVGLLVIPPAAARFWTDRFSTTLIIAGIIGMLAAVVGTIASGVLPVPKTSLSKGWPTGPTIILVAGVIFFLSLCFAPRAGVIAAFIRQRRNRSALSESQSARMCSTGNTSGKGVA